MKADERFPGFTTRLTARVIESGYVRSRDGKPDALRFAHDLNTSSANVYRWLGGMFPDKWLPKIAGALTTTSAFLLFGNGDAKTTKKAAVDLSLLDADQKTQAQQIAELTRQVAELLAERGKPKDRRRGIRSARRGGTAGRKNRASGQ